MARQPPVPKAVQEEMFSLFSQTDPETEKPFTIEKVSSMLNLPTSTVGKYRQKWDERRQADDAMAQTAIRPDPLLVLQDSLRDVPGVADKMVDFVVKQAKRNPSIMQNPQELYRLLTEGVRLGHYHANLITAGVINALAPPQGPTPMWGAQGPVGYAGPQGPPPQAPYAYSGPMPSQPTPYGAPPPPWGWWPQGGPREALDAREVRDIVEETLRRHAPQVEAAPANVEEVHEPMLDEAGQPRVGPDGVPYVRYIRRPVTAAPLDPLAMIRALREADKDRGDPNLAALVRNQEQMLALMQAGNTRTDPTVQAALESLRENNATILAQLEGEKARREQAEKDMERIDRLQGELRVAETEVAKAAAGMPPDWQVAKTAIERAADSVKKVQENVDNRLDRLEKVAVKAFLPSDPGDPVPFTENDLSLLEARQRALDARQRAPAPPVEAGTPINGDAPTETQHEEAK